MSAATSSTMHASGSERLGAFLVFLSALAWSFGGAIGRFVETGDSWTIVFWRSIWAAAFLIGFMLWRDGPRGTLALFRTMGMPGLAVAVCFAIASTSFVVALAYTSVANILLMMAGVPLFAALISFLVFRERVAPATWAAIAAVIVGVLVMVSDSLGAGGSMTGDALALFIAIAFATATVLTRRHAGVRMTPATCLGTLIAAALAALMAGGYAVSARDMGFLFAFGALNLGLGMAFFASGARLVPAALAALIGTLEMILGPVWVWLVHAEVPSARTLIGGLIVLAALLAHVGLEFSRHSRPRKPGTTGLPTPH